MQQPSNKVDLLSNISYIIISNRNHNNIQNKQVYQQCKKIITHRASTDPGNSSLSTVNMQLTNMHTKQGGNSKVFYKILQ